MPKNIFSFNSYNVKVYLLLHLQHIVKRELVVRLKIQGNNKNKK